MFAFLKNRSIGVILGALIAITTAGSLPLLAHEAKCPYCSLDVVQDTDAQDNEVALRFGRKRIEYRCVFCALSEAQSEFKGDLSILAPSEAKGKPVMIARKEGKWSVTPVTAVFVARKVNHKYCEIGYRAFSTKPAFEEYALKHKERLGDVKPLTLEQMLELTKPVAGQ